MTKEEWKARAKAAEKRLAELLQTPPGVSAIVY